MKTHLIYCGLDSKFLDHGQADQLVRDLAVIHFPGGHTIHEATGRWAGVFGIYDEPTLIIEVWEAAGFGKPDTAKAASDYKDLAKQDSVVILEIPCEAVVI